MCSIKEFSLSDPEWFEKFAIAGDSYAMINLSKILISRGEDRAFSWLEKAEKLGQKTAIYMAQCYEAGIGVKYDPEKAFELYKVADKSDHDLYAAFFLGNCYAFGIGTKVDEKLAYDCYIHQSRSQSPVRETYLALANCFREGKGCIRNSSYADELYTKASTLPSIFE